ncbi:hypothetical protein CCP2SC5_140038 [Azospirillaceae bacterium]
MIVQDFRSSGRRGFRLGLVPACLVVFLLTVLGVERLLPAATHSARESQKLEARCATAVALGEVEFRQRIKALFVTYKERVPAYSDWLFDWTPSYKRDASMLRAAAFKAFEEVQNGNFSGLFSSIQTELSDQASEYFREKVLNPEESDRYLALAWMQAALVAGGLPETTPDHHFLPEIHSQKRKSGPDRWLIPPPGRSWLNSDLIMDIIDEPNSVVLLRTTRPLVARVAGLIIRSWAGVSTGRVARTFGRFAEWGVYGYIMGFGIGVAGAVSTYWSIDFVLSKIDEFLNRRRFESDVIHLLNESEDALIHQWSDLLRDQLQPRCISHRVL